LTFVLVFPFVFDQISFIPASLRILAISFSAQSPVPFGAGLRVTSTLPHLPVTLKGIE